jgi:hypothetical protein
MESFDWNFYLENNKDLVENGITTQEDAFTHWENFGINEGRTHKFLSNYFLEKYFKKFLEYQEKNELNKEDAWDLLLGIYNKNNNPEEKDINENNKEMDIENFDWKYYIEKNDDLRKSGILTKELAIKHWTECGKFENRKFKSIMTKNNNVNTKNIVFENFDWKFYLVNNLDLIDNHFFSKDQAWSHWINYGKYENRKVNTITPKLEIIKNDLNNFDNLEEKLNIDNLISEENNLNKYIDNKNNNNNISTVERIKNITNNLSNNKEKNISNNKQKKILKNNKNEKSKNIENDIYNLNNDNLKNSLNKLNNKKEINNVLLNKKEEINDKKNKEQNKENIFTKKIQKIIDSSEDELNNLSSDNDSISSYSSTKKLFQKNLTQNITNESIQNNKTYNEENYEEDKNDEENKNDEEENYEEKNYEEENYQEENNNKLLLSNKKNNKEINKKIYFEKDNKLNKKNKKYKIKF